jgi:GH18 family chitinase
MAQTPKVVVVAYVFPQNNLIQPGEMEFVDHNKLDGLDIDWEYPGQVGAGNRFRPEDKQDYTLLLKELRARFNHEEGSI